jgi:hypothetical protein
MSPARPPSAGRAGIRNAALRAAPADPAAVPPVLQSSTEPGAVAPVRDESAQVLRQAAARPTRITVDLVAELHSFLRAYAQARDVAAADVIRELIRQVRADPDLSARVTAELVRRQEALAEAMRAARE